jgi:hypothetical protein
VVTGAIDLIVVVVPDFFIVVVVALEIMVVVVDEDEVIETTNTTFDLLFTTVPAAGDCETTLTHLPVFDPGPVVA